MTNLLTLKYWFSFNQAQLLPWTLKFFVAFVALLIVLSIAGYFFKNKFKKSIYGKFWQKLANFFLSNAIIGLFLLFFNYELIPFLSARFWLLLWLILMIVWLFYIYKFLAAIPLKRSQMEKEREFRRYIP